MQFPDIQRSSLITWHVDDSVVDELMTAHQHPSTITPLRSLHHSAPLIGQMFSGILCL